MIIFGFDIPLVEVILILTVVIVVLLVESLILIALLVSQSSKIKRVSQLVQELSQTILQIKDAEIKELDKLKGRR